MTAALLQSINTKNKLYHKYKKTHNITIEAQYKAYKNRLEHLKRIAKKQYYTSQLNKYKDDPKQTWNIINSLINRKSTKSSLPEEFFINNESVSDPKTIANSFNKYFATVGSCLNNQLPSSNNNYMDFMKPSVTSSIFLAPTTGNEIQKIIKKLKLNSLTSLDIKVRIFKEVGEEISEFLSLTINGIFNTCIFPDSLKLAHVTPIFKSGEKKIFSNYRPISVLPVLSKIVEKCLYSRLINFLNKYNIITDYQFGFRKNYSTNLALIHYVNNLTKQLHSNNNAISVFIDLSKAFDTINHNILIQKLYHYGIRGNCLKLIKNYLTNRKQILKLSIPNIPINFSDVNNITCGVPQGSILGPLLFIIYINDLPNINTNSNFILYADDTTITEHHADLSILESNLNLTLASLYDWLISNRLTINIIKTNFMLFRVKNKTYSFSPKLYINSVAINEVFETKFLGLVIDNKLSWKPHLNMLTTKLSKNMSALYKLRGIVNHNTMRNMYYSFIYPLLIYGIAIWGHNYNSNLHKLNILQKRAVRLVNNQSYRAHTSVLFKHSGILRLNDVCTLETLKFVYKHKLKLLPVLYDNYFTYIYSTTRQCSLMKIPFARTNYRLFSIQIQGAKSFNQFFLHNQLSFDSIKSMVKNFTSTTLCKY